MLNISKQIYSGYGIIKDALPEAEVIPGGDSASERKKLQKHTNKYINLAEHENIPLPGFTLYKAGRKYWGSADQTWLVIDPRGFMVRISNQNLESILHVTGITEGLIQEKCVWARENAQTKMILVPISSLLYIEAVKNTELIEGKVDIKDVQIGDTVQTRDGLTGIYRGVLSLYGSMTTNHKSKELVTSLYSRRQIIEVDPGRYFYQTDAKILKVTNKTATPMTREDSARAINNDILTSTTYFCSDPSIKVRTHNYYSGHGLVKMVSVHTVSKPKVKLEEIDKATAINIFTESVSTGDNSMLAFCNAAGKYYILELPHTHLSNISTVTINNFDIAEVKYTPDSSNALSRVKDKVFWGSHKIGNENIDKYTKFYKITKTVKKDSYI